jgi:glutamyl-tRNA synthetase
MSPVRVRFAPSPTGALHLGSSLAAVANFLFARRAGGRWSCASTTRTPPLAAGPRRASSGRTPSGSACGSTKGPTDGGPYGPYRQSERQPLYREHAARLLAAGHAYRLDGSDAVHFRVPRARRDGRGCGRGEVRVPAGAVSDFVLLRDDGTATYTLATAVDDALMEISHVIRGEDHLTNTARQLLVLEALDLRAPRYAHTALLVGEDGSKLSKRHDAPSIAELRGAGYPPEALFNYLAQLACPAVGDEPALLGALVGRFELSHLSRGPSRFDPRHLDWLSQEHLKRLNSLELARRVGAVLELRGVPVHPAQLTALGPGLKGLPHAGRGVREAEAVLRPPRTRPVLDEAGSRRSACSRSSGRGGRRRSSTLTTPRG